MDKLDLDARFRVLSIVWAAMLAGVTFMTAVVWAVASGTFAPGYAGTLSPALAFKLLLLSPLAIAVGIARRNGDDTREHQPDGRLAAYHTRVIVALALQEGGGILGLTVSLLAARPTWALGVGALTALAMLLGRPRREELGRLPR